MAGADRRARHQPASARSPEEGHHEPRRSHDHNPQSANGDRTAIRQDGVALTLHRASRRRERPRRRVACRRAGVRPGDRVGVMLPNVSYFPVCYLRRPCAPAAAIVPMHMPPEGARGRPLHGRLGRPRRAVRLATNFAEAATSRRATTHRGRRGRAGGVRRACSRASEPRPATVDREPTDTAVILYTSGHDRDAQGRGG